MPCRVDFGEGALENNRRRRLMGIGFRWSDIDAAATAAAAADERHWKKKDISKRSRSRSTN